MKSAFSCCDANFLTCAPARSSTIWVSSDLVDCFSMPSRAHSSFRRACTAVLGTSTATAAGGCCGNWMLSMKAMTPSTSPEPATMAFLSQASTMVRKPSTRDSWSGSTISASSKPSMHSLTSVSTSRHASSCAGTTILRLATGLSCGMRLSALEPSAVVTVTHAPVNSFSASFIELSSANTASSFFKLYTRTSSRMDAPGPVCSMENAATACVSGVALELVTTRMPHTDTGGSSSFEISTFIKSKLAKATGRFETSPSDMTNSTWSEASRCSWSFRASGTLSMIVVPSSAWNMARSRLATGTS